MQMTTPPLLFTLLFQNHDGCMLTFLLGVISYAKRKKREEKVCVRNIRICCCWKEKGLQLLTLFLWEFAGADSIFRFHSLLGLKVFFCRNVKV